MTSENQSAHGRKHGIFLNTGLTNFVNVFLLKFMKENSTIAKPHLVEDFMLDLMAGHMEDGETLEFTRVSKIIGDNQHN